MKIFPLPNPFPRFLIFILLLFRLTAFSDNPFCQSSPFINGSGPSRSLLAPNPFSDFSFLTLFTSPPLSLHPVKESFTNIPPGQVPTRFYDAVFTIEIFHRLQLSSQIHNSQPSVLYVFPYSIFSNFSLQR